MSCPVLSHIFRKRLFCCSVSFWGLCSVSGATVAFIVTELRFATEYYWQNEAINCGLSIGVGKTSINCTAEVLLGSKHRLRKLASVLPLPLTPSCSFFPPSFLPIQGPEKLGLFGGAKYPLFSPLRLLGFSSPSFHTLYIIIIIFGSELERYAIIHFFVFLEGVYIVVLELRTVSRFQVCQPPSPRASQWNRPLLPGVGGGWDSRGRCYGRENIYLAAPKTREKGRFLLLLRKIHYSIIGFVWNSDVFACTNVNV